MAKWQQKLDETFRPETEQHKQEASDKQGIHEK